jgi:hypothetical protein
VKFGTEINRVVMYALAIKQSTSLFAERGNFVTILYYIQQN